MKLRFAITPADSIRTLFWLRNVAVIGQLVAIAVACLWLHLALPVASLLATVAALAGFNLFTAVRLHAGWHVTHLEVAGQLVADMLALTVLLYFSGGTVNPFAPLYLIPVSLAAIILPVTYAWGIAAVAIAAYSLLMVRFVPLAHDMAGMNGLFNLHVDGMWINFVLSAVLICAFLVSMARSVRRRDRELSRMRETALRNEHINAVATLAAGTAHELGTPLATMTILVSEMKTEYAEVRGLRDDLEVLASRIEICRERLNALRAHSAHAEPRAGQHTGLRAFLEHTLDRWRLVRPSIVLECGWQTPFADTVIRADDGLAQTLMNLLNNAADASLENGEHGISVCLENDGTNLRIRIEDRGGKPGTKLPAGAGEMFFTSKAHGLGLGLALSSANLERLGGQVTMTANAELGMKTEVRVPLASLCFTDGRQ